MTAKSIIENAAWKIRAGRLEHEAKAFREEMARQVRAVFGEVSSTYRQRYPDSHVGITFDCDSTCSEAAIVFDGVDPSTAGMGYGPLGHIGITTGDYPFVVVYGFSNRDADTSKQYARRITFTREQNINDKLLSSLAEFEKMFWELAQHLQRA